ncbi:transposase [Granulicatella elegans]|uniref:transposase n=1 Tax=Granulicatella elegans TaxID=137732 RepID=UPI0037BFEF85
MLNLNKENFIKVIKRVAYGYRNFENMNLRIKIIKGCFFTPVNRKSLRFKKVCIESF